MKMIEAALGAMNTSALMTCSTLSDGGPPSRGLRNRNSPRRNMAVMVSALLPSVSSAAAVISTAKPAIHSRMRPTGYHSMTGAAGAAPLPAAGAAMARPSNARWPSHQAGNATMPAKAMQ